MKMEAACCSQSNDNSYKIKVTTQKTKTLTLSTLGHMMKQVLQSIGLWVTMIMFIADWSIV
jgi:hypothetical protein